jgi:hypothetical protein
MGVSTIPAIIQKNCPVIAGMAIETLIPIKIRLIGWGY